MTDALATDIRCSVGWLFQEQGLLTTISDNSKVEYDRTLEDGTSTDQADKIWHDERTLVATSSEDLDLSALTSTLFGDTLTVSLLKIKTVFIVNLSNVTGDELLVKPSPVNPWTAPFGSTSDLARVPADSCLLLTNRKNGWTVVPGGSDSLRIDNPTASSITYRIVIVGTSL